MVGDLVETKVEKVVAGGDGLAHLGDGRVLFVPFSLPDENIRVRITQVKKDYSVGKIQEVVESSSSRIEPHCRHYSRCGGCQFQHVSYEGEIGIKEAFLKEILTRQAKVDIEPESIYPSPLEWGYRTKSEHPLAPGRKRPLLGYFERRTHNVVDVFECPVLAPGSMENLVRIRQIISESSETVHDEHTGKGNLRYVILKHSNKGETLIGFVTLSETLAGKTLAALMKSMDDLAGIVLNVNPDPGNRILGETTQVISGNGHVTEDVHGLELRVSFNSFFQANRKQAERIVTLVREFLEPEKNDVVVDAYAGVGMIGLSLAKDVKEIYAVESEPMAVSDGRRNALKNDLGNVTWLEGEASSTLEGLKYDLLVLDPPRKGLTDKVTAAVIDSRPRRISYVSCNPVTWARDIQPLIQNGYTLKRLAMIDMFPRTAHLELVSLLEIA